MTQDEKTKQLKERSTAYPSIILEDAVDFTTKLRESLGKGPYSREEAAKALGHVSLTGPAARKVAALVHYGLLERNGNAYNQSRLAQDIIKPLSDDQKEVSIKYAAVTPKLFEKLCEKFNGQALPTMLQNILMRENVSESAANEVARIFTETMKYANILVNGIIVKPDITDITIQVTQPDNAEDQNGKLSSPEMKKPNKIKESSDDTLIFDFTGGIQLLIPKTKQVSEAIMDGELKEVRKALTDFTSKYMKEDVNDTSLFGEELGE